jgi:hypothetical protein
MRAPEPMRGSLMRASDRALPPSGGDPAAAHTRLPDLAPFLPELSDLDGATRRTLLSAGREVLECRRVLKKGGLNIVGEVLRGQGEFVEMEHYPHDDVFDSDSASQYYYHAHRGAPEHGHFHTFVRAGAIPADVHPLAWPLETEPWPQGDDAISHLIAISMDAWGEPIGLFATNRWVTAETWYCADDVIGLLDRFAIDHAWPSWPTNRWLGAMLRLYRPWIEALIRHRDAVMLEWMRAHPGADVFEDRSLEITGHLPIDVGQMIGALEQSL